MKNYNAKNVYTTDFPIDEIFVDNDNVFNDIMIYIGKNLVSVKLLSDVYEHNDFKKFIKSMNITLPNTINDIKSFKLIDDSNVDVIFFDSYGEKYVYISSKYGNVIMY